MQDNGGNGENQKLIHCVTVNEAGESRPRYIELRLFNLWKFLMEQKHGMTVNDPCLCLWVPREEYQRKRNLFDHGGEAAAVDRIELILFDERRRFSSEIIRFVPTKDTQRMLRILRANAESHLNDTQVIDMRQDAGFAIRQYAHTESGALELELHVSS